MNILFLSFSYGVYLYVSDSDEQSIFNQTKTINQIMFINMLQNLSYRYYSLYSIIKCLGFELIHYAINLNIVSFSMIFIEFDYMFLSNNR